MKESVRTYELAAIRLPKPFNCVIEVLLLGSPKAIKRNVIQQTLQEVGGCEAVLDDLLLDQSVPGDSYKYERWV